MAGNRRIESIANNGELRPFDQIEEGVFVRSIELPHGEVEVGALTYTVEDVEGYEYKRPQWRGCKYIHPEYPIRVVRGMEPPRAQ